MDGIRATRSSTGETVEIGLDDDGRLCALTPDGSVLQVQTVKASRIKLKADRLKWSGVDYEVEDEAAARRLVESLAPPGRDRRRMAAFVALFAIGLVLGALGGVFLLDREPSASCDEAREVIDTAEATMEEITNQAEEQDRSFFAAIIVEHGAITYAMRSEPTCFSLTERAAAEGFLEGLRGLLSNAPG